MDAMKEQVILALAIFLSVLSGQSFAEGDATLSADQVRHGCSIVLHKIYRSDVDSNVNAAVFDQQILWKCTGADAIPIGTIGAEGNGPEIVTIFYRANEIVVLARWTSGSAGATFQGEFYQVNAYRLEKAGNRTTFRAEPNITKAFGDGHDGMLDDKRVTFPYKNAAAIHARLKELGL